jgi:hypothetical protein
MKFAAERPYGDPDKAARKLVDIANAVEPAQDGRIFIELINWPFLHDQKGNPAEYKAGLDLAIARGWRWAPIRYFHPGPPKCPPLFERISAAAWRITGSDIVLAFGPKGCRGRC